MWSFCSRIIRRQVISCKEHLGRHFTSTRFAVARIHSYEKFHVVPKQLIVTHCSRFDVILELIALNAQARARGTDLKCGLVLHGIYPPNQSTCKLLETEGIPTLYVGKFPVNEVAPSSSNSPPSTNCFIKVGTELFLVAWAHLTSCQRYQTLHPS